MAALLRAGKIRSIGVSNCTPEQMDAFRTVAPLHTTQASLNIFERESEIDVLPYCGTHAIVTLVHGAVCGGMLSGRMTIATRFNSDNPRRRDPKFRAPRLHQYLNAVAKLDRFAQANYHKRVAHLALRWTLDRTAGGVTLWGACQPHQLDPLSEVTGWKIDRAAMAEIDRILAACIVDPVGPDFMTARPIDMSLRGVQSPTRMLISVGANDVRATE
jgi:aryl-alcohol dehydrogenase-like predicted oxidoreductase